MINFALLHNKYTINTQTYNTNLFIAKILIVVVISQTHNVHSGFDVCFPGVKKIIIINIKTKPVKFYQITQDCVVQTCKTHAGSIYIKKHDYFQHNI